VIELEVFDKRIGLRGAIVSGMYCGL